MSYQTYITKALVCGSVDSYTSDRSYLLFTREAGMLWATARSVREEKSKQRNSLQDFSFVRVSLIKGKGGWRIGSVEARGNPFLSASTRMQRGLVSYIVMNLRRYVHGESSIVNVYDDVETVLTRKFESNNVTTVQVVFLLRLLNTLGYIASDIVFSKLIDSSADICKAIEDYDDHMLPKIEQTIEKASHASHL